LELRDFKQQHKGQFDQLCSDNERLSRTCQEQDNTIKNLHGDVHKLSKKLEDSNFDLHTTKSALRARDENLSHVQKKLDEFSRTCQEQDNTIKNLDGDVHKLSKKLEDSNFDLNSTKSALRARDENLSHVQKQLDDANKSLARLQVNTRLKI